MTRFEEKLYLQSVFDAIDEVYKLKNHQQTLTYEERLRASFSKLLVPNWYNHDYTSVNGLRKTKSHGQVPRIKRYDYNNNYNDSPDTSTSSTTNSPRLPNDPHRYRSASQSWSERRPFRQNSTTSSYDTNGSGIINGRHSTNSNGIKTYAPGLQRVAQSSTWYKPKTFTTKSTNGHSIESPKPLPRYSKIDPERINSLDSSLSLSSLKLRIPTPISNGNVRHPIKPRTMSQIPISTRETDEQSSLLNVSLDVSSDGDITVVQKPSSSRPTDVSALKYTHVSPPPHIIIDTPNKNDPMPQSMKTNIPRSDSTKSIPSDAESYYSTILPLSEKNLLITDSSSYGSVNEQCSSISTSSYHTAAATSDMSELSSITGYKTPTPQLDDETLSSHSSISDLSHTETLEPHPEDLDIVAASTGEQKSAIILPVNVGMENLPLPSFSSSVSHTSSSSVSDNSPSTESRPIDNTNWYDDGSIETCIHPTSSTELHEIANEDILHEVDLNGVSDEFLLFSPRNTTDDEPSSSFSDDKYEIIGSPIQTSKRTYTMENKNSNLNDDATLAEEFENLSNLDPFTYNNNNTSSLLITNLDDILIDDDDDEQNHLSNSNYRRPIQEDILYEVEHENSYSDHSQATSLIIVADDNASIKVDPNLDLLTSTEELNKSNVHQPSLIKTSSQEKESKQNTNDSNTLPIYILPPLNTTSTTREKSSSLHIDTSNYPYAYKWDTSAPRYSDLSSPSSYTPKIRHRHFSVGSYYDHKTTTVAMHPNHKLYILSSAPVSPTSRTSTASSESHYYVHHHSPIAYENVTYNALRRINPFLETNNYMSNYDYKRSPSLNRDELYRTTISYPEDRTMPFTQTESVRVVPQSISSPSSTHTRSVSVPHYEVPNILPKMISTSPPPVSPPPFQQEPPLVRPKTSRGRPRSPPISPPPRSPPFSPPPRTTSIEKDETQDIYQEIDSISTDDDQTTPPNADLQFIRGTIERVFDFHGESPSELSTNNDEISEDNKNDKESISLSNSSKTVSKKTNQSPAVEAVQRFYHNKNSSDSEKKNLNEQTTNLDEIPISNHSATSNKLYARSHPINVRKKELSQSKSSDIEQATSEEIDDTLNDIEDEDSQDEKLKRQATNNSSPSSHENSPVHSSSNQTKLKKTSQETQTLQRQQPIILTTQSPSPSQSTVQSYETACSNIPPLDIVTQMVIERNDGMYDGEIGEISGDMVIFYDDIEIVEHSSNISSSESYSTSSFSKPIHNSKPVETIIIPVPPPIPARTLKPVHLLNNQQQSPSTPRNEPSISSTSKVNRIYELEKSTIRKKFDVNSVNNILEHTDYHIGPTASHRHPSARHFVGKLNSDDTSSRHSSTTSPNIPSKPSSSMIKSQTLPLQSITTNGHAVNDIEHTPTKNPFSTLPTRSVSSAGTNGKHRSIIADTNALVKQIQTSLSRNSLHDSQINSPLSVSTKDLRSFVSSTYSPTDENMIDDDGIIHVRQHKSTNYDDDQAFKRQARLSKSFHNVSEYNSIDQYPPKENNLTSRTQPSKSVENNLNRVSQNQIRHPQIPFNFPPIAASTSFAALTHAEDNARMLSMKWYTGQVSENSEICYTTPHVDNDDLLYGYISRHTNQETQSLLARLQASNDIRVHAALDDIRLRVAQFDASKSPEDLHVFMRYLESRLRNISNKTPGSSAPSHTNGQRRISNGETTNGYHTKQQQQKSDTVSIKSRTSSIATGVNRETPPPSRQLGRQNLRSSGNIAGGETNGHQPLPPPRRPSQSSVNQENPAVFDDMLNTVLGLPKKGVATLPQTYPSSLLSREKPTPLSTNTSTGNKTGRDTGKRLFESGAYKDTRLVYDGSKKNEKEEQPLETSV